MLDFAFGPNGYGFGEGMRKEQDRITQNRSAFANNMATFLANNPYISPEAAQAFINSAAGTDLTLVGSVPNQLVGEINQENQRKRRIDNFRFFNEYLRANPGATAVEMQDALSALGAQGIYGDQAIKAIQQRSDQYRKDLDTKRQFEQAQNIGQLRTSMMSDVEYQYAANGYDPDKTLKAIKSIYGDNPPVPYETLINPGSARVAQQRVVREYLPKAIEIIGNNPNMTPEMLYGIWPELQGSTVVKSIYDAAQTERKNAVQSKFNTNRLPIIDSAVKLMQMGRTRDEAIQQAALSAGLTPADVQNLDLSSAAEAAEVQFKKVTTDAQTALDQKKAQASANVASGILSGLSNEMEAKRLAAMSDSQLELEIRKKVEMVSGLTKDEINSLPYQWYNNIATSIRGELNTRSLAAQEQKYDAVVASEPKISAGLTEKSVEAAKNFSSPSAIQRLKSAGLENSPAGNAIPSIMNQLAQSYDVTGVNGEAINDFLISAAQKQPDADSRTLMSAIPAELLRPISDMTKDQIERTKFETGALAPKPIRARDYVGKKSSEIYSASQKQISDIIEIAKNENMTVDQRLSALSRAKQAVASGVQNSVANYTQAIEFSTQWDFNDPLSYHHVTALSNELSENAQRVIKLIDASIADLQSKERKAKAVNMAPAELMKGPVDPGNSNFYNTVIAPFAPTPGRIAAEEVRREIISAMPATPNSSLPILGRIPGVDTAFNALNPSNYIDSSADLELANAMARIVNDQTLLTKVVNNPALRELLKTNPRAFVDQVMADQ